MATIARRQGRAGISTAELNGRLGEEGLRIVDVRPLPAEYNGWRSPERDAAGTSPAQSRFPPNGSRGSTTPNCGLVDNKDIADSAEVVVYGESDGCRRRLGAGSPSICREIRSYEGGWTEWSADESLPIERLANYERLIHPAGCSSSGRRPARGGPAGTLPPLPRQLRRARGVR